MARHTELKVKRDMEMMSFIITCRAWKALFQEKNKKKKINWKGKRKKGEVKKMMQQGNLVLIKIMIKGGCVLTALRVLN